MIRNTANGKMVAETLECALSRSARRRGLLGRDRLAPGHALVITPCSAVHTWFMRFPIDVIFMTREGRVVKTCPAVPPWRLAFGWGAYAAVEVPSGTIQQAGVKKMDRLEWP